MTENNHKIHIIATGGTIDKFYNSASQQNELKEKSIVPEYLKGIIGQNLDFGFSSILNKDSRDLIDLDREKILKTINDCHEDKIIILHGTDTMALSAQYILDKINNKNKVIIFTGSMIPLDGFIKTDAPFNLGYAIGVIKNIKSGVYICMNGMTFNPNEAIKNIEKSCFEYKDAS